MAVLNILRAQGNDILRIKSGKVVRIDRKTQALLADMEETLLNSGGLGLAAPQVGVSQRLFVVRNGGAVMKFVNPVIVQSEGEQLSFEACLSLPGIFAKVVRPARVVVSAINESGKPFELEARDRLACAISHEADHLDGILFTDKAYQIRRLRTAR
jgi:peptide deformylase